MRIVVFSDSHRNFFALQSIVFAQPKAALFLHLGDGEREFEDLQTHFPDKLMRGVCGNCDWSSCSKVSDLITCEGKRIFFTHGHIYGVKIGLGELVQTARNFRADVVLFGHTHHAYTAYENGLHLMNPGSVTSPAEGRPSYGIVDITPAGIVTSIVQQGQGRMR